MKTLFLRCLAFALLFAQNCPAITIEHTLAVKVGIFDAAKASLRYQIEKDNYSISSKVETSGIFGGIYPFVGKYFSDGKINGDAIITRHYRYLAKSRFNTRTKELVYDENGNVLYRLSSKNNKQKKSDVTTKKENSGATDLQSVFIMLAKQIMQKGFCASDYPVFDGKKSFTVGFVDLGESKIENDNKLLDGKAMLCSMYIDNNGQKNNDLLFDSTTEKQVEISLLRTPEKGFPYVAQVKIADSPLGAVIAETTDIKIEE